MAKLTTARRNKLPTPAFAGPDRSYPVPDRAHAANAKARASQAVNAGRMSEATEEKIDAKANRVLGKGGSHGKGGMASHPNMAHMHNDGPMHRERY